MHYIEDALLREVSSLNFQLTFKNVTYGPTDDPEALGTLLFGLRPRGLRVDCQENRSAFLHRTVLKAQVLHLHANRKVWDTTGVGRVALEDLRAWVQAAVRLAPDAESAGQARRLIDENLGPHAYED